MKNSCNAKFSDPFYTVDEQARARVDLVQLKTLWFNTGTLCNLACANCYIESSPKNDRLVYISHEEVCFYLDEIEAEGLGTQEIGLTGGEPFMNGDIIPIMEECLKRGFQLLVLTNAMRPMMKCADEFLRLLKTYRSQMKTRVSVDHYKQERHEEERGPRSWEPTIKGLQWLSDNGFSIDVAGRTFGGEKEDDLRSGFADLFKEYDIKIDPCDPESLVLFPEMDEKVEVPEITTKCWDILGVSPNDMMCATSRMVVKHNGADRPVIQACTLLAYEKEFEMGQSLKESAQSVSLNHPHCAKFCVLGGGSCTAKDQ